MDEFSLAVKLQEMPDNSLVFVRRSSSLLMANKKLENRIYDPIHSLEKKRT